MDYRIPKLSEMYSDTVFGSNEGNERIIVYKTIVPVVGHKKSTYKRHEICCLHGGVCLHALADDKRVYEPVALDCQIAKSYSV